MRVHDASPPGFALLSGNVPSRSPASRPISASDNFPSRDPSLLFLGAFGSAWARSPLLECGTRACNLRNSQSLECVRNIPNGSMQTKATPNDVLFMSVIFCLSAFLSVCLLACLPTHTCLLSASLPRPLLPLPQRPKPDRAPGAPWTSFSLKLPANNSDRKPAWRKTKLHRCDSSTIKSAFAVYLIVLSTLYIWKNHCRPNKRANSLCASYYIVQFLVHCIIVLSWSFSPITIDMNYSLIADDTNVYNNILSEKS